MKQLILVGILSWFAVEVGASPCDPKCNTGQGWCQSGGRCLCWWGWTGPNAVYVTTGPLKNRILADYCSIACHYTLDHRNPNCARIPSPPECSIPSTPVAPPLPCDSQCNAGVYHGQCLSNGRCLCWWGWTGPNSCYVAGNKTFTNRILAEHCNAPCHYTHDYRNASCVSGFTKRPTKVPGTTQLSTQLPTKRPLTTAAPCNPNCTVRGHGQCQSNGRCLCWWGWTGPHAVYILTGVLKNRIQADYCFTACHYTHDYLNPACASIPVPPVCSIPPTPVTPPRPCDPQCNAGVYHGECLSNGRCLCWWGWTGPNSCYVSGNKTFTNRILADSCNVPCHYTHDHRNPNCVTNYTAGASGTKGTAQRPTVVGRSEPPEPPRALNPDGIMALGAKSDLETKEKQTKDGKMPDTGKGADSPSTGSSAGVSASLAAVLCVVAIMAVVLWAYRRHRRRNRVGQQPVVYSNREETEPLLKPFHYNKRT